MLLSVLNVLGCALIILMVLPLYRAVVGPTTIDRLIGVNLIGTKTMILLLLVGLFFESLDMFIDLALTYALLNFLGATAAAHLLARWGNPDL